MDNQDKNIWAKLLGNMPAEKLASIARAMNSLGSIPPEAAKAWKAFTESEKREEERLREVLPSRRSRRPRCARRCHRYCARRKLATGG
jgi:hypothetical protein